MILISFNIMILGVPEDRNAFTINKVCSSSLKALILATQVNYGQTVKTLELITRC